MIRYCKTILGAIFTTALNDLVHLHPVRGVKSPRSRGNRIIVAPEQFDKIYLALPAGTARLLAETDIESGLHWGKLTELRPKDIDFRTGVLTVSRVVGRAITEIPPGRRPVPDQGIPQGPALSRALSECYGSQGSGAGSFLACQGSGDAGTACSASSRSLGMWASQEPARSEVTMASITSAA